jgi:hypothetical protein
MGVADPVHGDFEFTAPSWEIGVRLAPSNHFRVAVAMSQWRHVDESIMQDVPINGLNGLLGRAARIEDRHVYTTRTLGIAFLAAGSSGRATFTGGGGPGYMQFSRHSTTKMEGCTGGATCGNSDFRFSNGDFAVQAVAAVDVAITSRVGAFGQYQFAFPVQDVGSGHNAFIGGVRVRLL